MILDIGKVGITPKGAYSAQTTYEYLDGVKKGDYYYISKQDSNLGHSPESSPLWWELVVEGKPEMVIETIYNETDSSLPITSLSCLLDTYYKIQVPVNTINITLPVIPSGNLSAKNVLIYLTTGSTPAVTISSSALEGNSLPPIYYQERFIMDKNNSYEINCLWNGASWVIGGFSINIV